MSVGYIETPEQELTRLQEQNRQLLKENERLKIEREFLVKMYDKMYDLGYEKGVTDTLLDYGVDP